MRRVIPLVIALALITSACQIRVDSLITVNGDESGTFGVVVAFDEEFRGLVEEQGGDLDLGPGVDALPAGWTEEAYSEDGFEGSLITASFSDFADLQRLMTELQSVDDGQGSPNSLFNNLVLARDGDDFRFEARLEGIEEGFGDTGGDVSFEGADGAALFASLFDIRYLVSLPGSIGNNNADVVDGNTLIWSIGLTDDGRVLSATSSPGGFGIMPIVVVAALLVGIGAFVAMRRRSGGEAEVVASEALAAAAEAYEAAEQLPASEGDPFAA